MRFAWWAHTTNASVASYRLRCLGVIEELRRRGVQAALFRPDLRSDVLVLSKRYDAASLRTAQLVRQQHGTRLVLDLCDNHFYAANDMPKWRRRAEELRAAVREVDLVVVSTDTLEAVVQAEAGRPVATVVIGDAVEMPSDPGWSQRWRHLLAEQRLSGLSSRLDRQPVAAGRRLLWFGNHGSDYAEGGMADLCSLQAMLESAHREAPLNLTIVSNNRRKFAQLTGLWKLPAHYLEWHPNTFSRALRLHDVALIPVRPNPFTLCKTNNRVATALLHGLAVAADAIPSYRPLADCAVLDNWQEGLQRLMADADCRMACVARGSELVRSQWSIEQISSQWLKALQQLGSRA
jgi:hypothetical protein